MGMVAVQPHHHRDARVVTYEESYWATKHFSFYVEPGSARLATKGDMGLCTAVNGGCGGAACGETSYQIIAFVTLNEPPRSLRPTRTTVIGPSRFLSTEL
eukprot:m.473515 g.473515  ORF g.473515 m.473515 type:complete len:100 (-) comp34489_c0_seq1:96-395(-)